MCQTLTCLHIILQYLEFFFAFAEKQVPLDPIKRSLEFGDSPFLSLGRSHCLRNKHREKYFYKTLIEVHQLSLLTAEDLEWMSGDVLSRVFESGFSRKLEKFYLEFYFTNFSYTI